MHDQPSIGALPPGSLSLSQTTKQLRIDDSPEETQQHYLQLSGTPEGLRWLAAHLLTLAQSAEEHGTPTGNVLAPWDLSNRPVTLSPWDALEFHCKTP